LLIVGFNLRFLRDYSASADAREQARASQPLVTLKTQNKSPKHTYNMLRANFLVRVTT